MVKNRLSQIMVHFSGLIIIASISVPIVANDSDPNEKLADRRDLQQEFLDLMMPKDLSKAYYLHQESSGLLKKSMVKKVLS